MTFAQPLYFLAGLLLAVILIVSSIHFEGKRRKALEAFAANKLLKQLLETVSNRKRMIKKVLMFCGLFMLVFSLTRPQFGFTWKEVKRKGIDILIALDTSKSMLTSDVKPNRLERAKLGLMDFVTKLDGDRVGLMPFAGEAFLMCPMTLDYDAFIASLKQIDTSIVPTGGTNIQAVLEHSETVFQNDSNHKILVLITDGESLQGDVLKAAQEAAKKGISVYSVGIGSTDGELISVPDGKGGNTFLKDSKGNFVKSRLDEKALKEIARITKGLYTPLGAGAEGLDIIYQEKLNLIPKEELAERMSKQPIERFQWPLALAVIFFIAEFMLGDRKSRNSLRNKVSVVLALFFATTATSFAGQRAAFKYFKEGKYEEALEQFNEMAEKEPANPVIKFNQAITEYQMQHYEEATEKLKDIIAVSTDINLQQRAYKYLGNISYRLGSGLFDQLKDMGPLREVLKTQPEQLQQQLQQIIKAWKAAIKSYDGALAINSEDKVASENKNVTKTKLDALKALLPKPAKSDQKNKDSEESDDSQDGESGDQQNSDDSKEGDQQDSDDSKDGDQQDSDDSKDGDQQQNQNNESEENQDDKSNQQQNGDESDKSDQQDNGQQEEEKEDEGKEEQSGEESDDKPENSKPKPVNVEPGKMSEEEAKQLLDSQKENEGVMPLYNNRKNKTKPQSPVMKDW